MFCEKKKLNRKKGGGNRIDVLCLVMLIVWRVFIIFISSFLLFFSRGN